MSDIEIKPGEVLEVSYSAKNVGTDTATQDIRLLKDGTEVAADAQISIGVNTTRTGVLEWESTDSDADTQIPFRVVSENTEQSFSVQVLAAIPDGGVSRWKFDQDVADSWDGNGGTLTGGTFTTNNQVGTYALSLDGTDDLVEVPYNSNLTPSELSISVWFKTDANTGDFAKIGGKQGPRYDQSYYLALRGDIASNSVRFNVSETSDTISFVDSTTDVYDNNWHHVVGTLGPSNGQTIYVDGVSEDSNSNTSVVYDGNSTPFYWGQRPDGSQHFSGVIDDGRVYDKELTATEVNNLYTSGSI